MFGGLNPISMIATAALGPLGGIVAQLAQQVLSQVGQQILAQVGEGVGAPQSSIEMAQGALAGSVGDTQGSARNLSEAVGAYGAEVGASASEIGEAQRNIQDMATKASMDALESPEAKEAKAGGKGGSWLMALAKALGAQADMKADKLSSMTEGLNNAKPSETAIFQAETQEFNLLMQAITSTIKGIGEALGTMAKRG